MTFDNEPESFTGPLTNTNSNWNEIATTCQTQPAALAGMRNLPVEFGSGTLQLVDSAQNGLVHQTGVDRPPSPENRPEQPSTRGGPLERVRGFLTQLIDAFVPQQYRDMARGIVDQVSTMFRDGRVSMTPRDGGHDISLDLSNTPIAQMIGRLPGNISVGRLSFHANRGRISNIQGLQVGGHSVHSADLNTGQVTTGNGSYTIPRLTVPH